MINVKTSRPYDFFTFTVNFTAALGPYYTLGKVLKNTFAVTPNVSIDSSLYVNYVYVTLNNFTEFYGPYDPIEVEASVLENSGTNNAEIVSISSSLNLGEPGKFALVVYKLDPGAVLNDYKIKVTVKKYLITPGYASYVNTAYAGAVVNPLNWSNLVY